MTSNFRKWLSALLAVIMTASPMAASLAEDEAHEIMVIEEQTEVAHAPAPASEPAPAQESEPEPVRDEATAEPEEQLVPEDELEAPVETEAPEEAPQGSAPEAPVEDESSEEESPEGQPSEDQPSADEPSTDDRADSSADEAPEQAPEAEQHPVVAEPVYATSLDAGAIISPVYVPYGTKEGELPLPATLPAQFSDGSGADVAVVWYCTGNTFNGQGYIPDCEDRGAVFYFQATPVGVSCLPSLILPAVTVMYAPELEAAYDHAAISFAGTDILIAQGATVTTDDILNENGYDPAYRIVCEGIIAAGESGRAIPNPVKLSGAIRGGSFDGEIELARGTIRGGTFNARVECARGAIHGGTFNAAIGGPAKQIYVSIYGGTFRGGVGESEYDGYIFIHGGEFYCDVRCRNLTVDGDSTFYNADGEGGARRTVTLGTVGTIAGGTFYADVLNRNNIIGGTFYGKVTNGGTQKNCNVLGGTFYGEFDNSVGGKVFEYGTGSYGGAQFLGDAELRNSGEIDAGEKVGFADALTVTNEPAGVIKSGAYPCKIVNYGTIVGGKFPGSVINRGTITGGTFDGELYNEGGTVAGAALNCMLMANSGKVTLGGIVADTETRTVTVAAGRKVTTDQILVAIGGDAADYVLHNQGEITGGDQALLCDFAPDSTGAISGGSFGGSVCAGAISGGKFSGAVRADSVSDGNFAGRVNVRNSITGGSFGADSRVTAGVIAGGSFAGEITSAERELLGFITITGGTFTGGVATGANDGIVINGGTFNCPVGHCVDAARNIFDGYVIVRAKEGVAAPKFNGSYVGGHNVVVECGEFSENTKVAMYSSGSLAGGTYRGPVYCNNAITGGTFYGEVTMNANANSKNSQIHGGTFYGVVNNKQGAFINEQGLGGNPPPKFLAGEIVNEGVMDPGAGAEFAPQVTIVNQPSGNIRGGVYNSPVRNFGTIARGTFNAPVTSFSPMSASAATFNDILMDVPAQTLTIPADARKSFADVRAMEGYAASTRIINNGTLYSDGGDSLPNDVENRGYIESGSYSGTIKLVGMENQQLLENKGGRIRGGTFSGTIYSYYGVISGGTFNGPVKLDGGTLVITITGGTFNETVGEPYNGYVFVYRADGTLKTYGANHNLDSSGPVFYKLVAARNLNITCGTFNGPVEMSTVGQIENGLFKGKVTCHNIISGGEFCEAVKVCSGQNSYISGGLFHQGTEIESGTAIKAAAGANGSAIAFDGGKIANSGTLDPGEGASFGEKVTIQNAKGGNILSGTYRGAMVNYGTISNAVLLGSVRNEGRIINSTVKGQLSGEGSVSLEGVEVSGKTITIRAGCGVSTEQLAGLMDSNQSGYTVINGGTITAGSDGEALACTIQGGTVRGGNFTGSVYARVIEGGVFDGPVCAKVIDGGTFNASVRDFTDRSVGSLSVAGMDKTGGLSISGGTFKGALGGAGLDDAIFVHGGDFSACKGINAWNFTVDTKSTVTFGGPVCFKVGEIAGGTFNGVVTGGNKISGGVFNGKVVNNDLIVGGTFNGGIENHAVIKSLESYNYSVAERRADGSWHVETRARQLDGTFLNCDVQNLDGGTIESGVTWGTGRKPSGAGDTYVAAFIGSTDGTGKTYNAHEFRYGENVSAKLASLDEAQSTRSKWTKLDGSSIASNATISLDPMQNLFLRESSLNILGGVLQLDSGWSSEGSEPAGDYTAVHIPGGRTVSAGNWTHPVTNDGAITGGSFVNLTNNGTVTGATISGVITAVSGTIEDCSFGPGARVASVGSGATILVGYTAEGASRKGRYGAKVLEALDAVRKPEIGYQWYNLTANRAVNSGDTFTLASASYEIRTMPAPEILWPTDAAMGINCALSTATFTDRDPNGSFAWASPSTIVRTEGKQSFEMIFTPDAGNTYNYAGIATRKSVSVQVSSRVITIQVDSYTKRYGDAEPTYTGTTIGLREGESVNRFFRRMDASENVGTYEITAVVNACPAGCTVRVIPGTLTIEPLPLDAAAISIVEGSKKYAPADRYAKSYTGAALRPSIQVSFKNKTLVEGRDYTLSYRANTEPGTAYIDVTGIGNYSGQASRTFSITAGKATLTIEPCTKQFGDPDPQFRASVSGVAYPSGVSYELYRESGERVGTYSIKARKLSGPFDLDVKSGLLTITARQLPSDVSAPAPQPYTGSAVTPKPTVREAGKALSEGSDYTLSYENNVNAGTATVVIHGKGNYAGTQRVQFTIQRAKAEIRVDSATKNFEDADPKFTATVVGALGKQKLDYSLRRDAGEQVGEYAIRAVPGDNPNYDVTTVPGTLRILPVVARIDLSESQMTLDEGGSRTLRYTFYPDVASASVKFSSGDNSVATVGADGTVRAVQAGATNITAKTDNGKTATCRVTVRPTIQKLTLANGESKTLSVAKRHVDRYDVEDASVASVDSKGKITAKMVGVTFVTASAGGAEIAKWELSVTPAPTKVILSQDSAKLGAGQTVQLSAGTDEGSGEIHWSSNKTNIASVDANGLVTAKKAGSAKITATSANGKTAVCQVTVTKAPTSLKLGAGTAKLGVGDSMELRVTLKGGESEVHYESTNPHIATVADGKIVAGSIPGTATITASTYNNLKASCTVTVLPKPTSISLGGDLQLGEKQSQALSVRMEPSNAFATLRYESSNPGVATVNEKGEVAGVKGGSAVISVYTDNGLSASANVTVKGAPTGVKFAAKKASIGAGQTYQIEAEVLGEEAELSWSSNKNSVATVDERGLVTGLKAGSATITAKTYNNKKATFKITVTKAPTSIKLNLDSVTLGEGEQSAKLKVTLSKKTSSEIKYSYSNEGIAKVEGDHIVGLARGSTTITASTYNGLTATCRVTVLAAPTVIDLGEDCSLKVKKTLTLNPVFGDGEGGALSFSSSNKKIATVDAHGKVKAKKAGTVVITATAYNGATGSVTITVTKK